jgi:hypothetical protein
MNAGKLLEIGLEVFYLRHFPFSKVVLNPVIRPPVRKVPTIA